MDKANRPLSPHLQVYGWYITNTLSILHRMTGLVLTLAAVTLAAWLLAVASGSAGYERAYALFASVPVRLLFVVVGFCFFYHLANGIRHLLWDAGYGFDRDQIRISGWTVVAFAALATLIFAIAVIV